MATGKKSFVAYADWKNTFDELPNEEAGALIKHIFAYVNDENPESDSVLIRAIFANIKSTLKRDLDKWESQLTQRSDAGKRSAKQRALNKSNERSTVVDFRVRNLTDSVSVNDNVSVNEKKEYIIINNASFSQKAKMDKQWTETIAMQSKIKPEIVMLYVDSFESHLITMQEQKDSENAFKRHFTHWLNKQDLSQFRERVVGKTNQI